jgi:hypothetical protein
MKRVPSALAALDCHVVCIIQVSVAGPLHQHNQIRHQKWEQVGSRKPEAGLVCQAQGASFKKIIYQRNFKVKQKICGQA